MKTFRVVCTTDTNKENNNLIVDFAAADIKNARITHYQLLRLRQDKTPGAQQELPPLNIQDNGESTKIAFEKPEIASQEAKNELEKLSLRICLEYARFKSSGLESTIPITAANIGAAYDFINPNTMVVSSPEEERLREDIERSRRSKQTRAMKRGSTRPPLYMTGYKNK